MFKKGFKVETTNVEITNGEVLAKYDLDKLLDTACGFACEYCACQPRCNGIECLSVECKCRKMNWLSDWATDEFIAYYESRYKKQGNHGEKSVRCIETGKVYSSMANAQADTGIKVNRISEVCRGNSKTAGGYHWEFA